MASPTEFLKRQSARIRTAAPDGPTDQAYSTITLGLVPSPGLPEDIADEIADDLVGELTEQVDNTVVWRIRILPDPLSGSEVETPDLLGELNTLAQADHWDYSISLTDLPIRREKRVVLADVSTNECAGWISIPALGIFHTRRRVRHLIVQLVRDLHSGTSSAEDVEEVIGTAVGERGDPHDAPDVVDTRWVASPSKLAYVRLLSGMVYANEPWTIFPSFKTTIATAVATGSYALIFTSVWELGELYSIRRLGALVAMAIAILSAWVIMSHQLWQPHRGASSQFLATLYNTTTVVTVGSAVVFAYTLVFLMLLFEGSVFMPPGRLESMFGRAPDPTNYIAAALVAGSVGTLAGALGAGLEDTDTVRRATFGWRQQQRFAEYEQVRAEENEDTEQNP